MNLGRIIQATEQFQEIGGKNASGGKLYVFIEPSQTLRASTLYKVGNHEILPNPLTIDDRGQVEDFLVDAEYEYYLIVKDIEGEEIFTRHNVTCVDGGEGAMANDYYEGDFIRIDEDRTINVGPLKRLAVETPLTLTESENELLIGIDASTSTGDSKDYIGRNGIEVIYTGVENIIDGSALQDKDMELEDRIGTYDGLINDLTERLDWVVQDVANKQDKLTPGTNIEITTGGTINCTIDTSQFTTNADLTNNYYTKDEVDNTYATKDEIPDVSGFITKTDADNYYALIGDYYTKVESDGKYATKSEIPDVSGFVTKTEADATYQEKGDYQPAGSYQPAGDYPTRAEISTTYQKKLIAGTNVTMTESDDGVVISSNGFKPYVYDVNFVASVNSTSEVTSLTLHTETSTNNPKIVYNTETSTSGSMDLVPSFGTDDVGKILSVTQRDSNITLEWKENNKQTISAVSLGVGISNAAPIMNGQSTGTVLSDLGDIPTPIQLDAGKTYLIQPNVVGTADYTLGVSNSGTSNFNLRLLLTEANGDTYAGKCIPIATTMFNLKSANGSNQAGYRFITAIGSQSLLYTPDTDKTFTKIVIVNRGNVLGGDGSTRCWMDFNLGSLIITEV